MLVRRLSAAAARRCCAQTKSGHDANSGGDGGSDGDGDGDGDCDQEQATAGRRAWGTLLLSLVLHNACWGEFCWAPAPAAASPGWQLFSRTFLVPEFHTVWVCYALGLVMSERMLRREWWSRLVRSLARRVRLRAYCRGEGGAAAAGAALPRAWELALRAGWWLVVWRMLWWSKRNEGEEAASTMWSPHQHAGVAANLADHFRHVFFCALDVIAWSQVVPRRSTFLSRNGRSSLLIYLAHEPFMAFVGPVKMGALTLFNSAGAAGGGGGGGGGDDAAAVLLSWKTLFFGAFVLCFQLALGRRLRFTRLRLFSLPLPAPARALARRLGCVRLAAPGAALVASVPALAARSALEVLCFLGFLCAVQLRLLHGRSVLREVWAVVRKDLTMLPMPEEDEE